jgi:TonB family protein
MIKKVGIIDPVSLEMPELALCLSNPLPTSVYEGEGVSRRRLPFAPCLSLAVVLHGTIALLAFTMGMGVHVPESVISISLLPAMNSDSSASGGGLADVQPDMTLMPKPAPPRQAETRKPAETVMKSESRQFRAKPAAPVKVAAKKDVVPPVANIAPKNESRKTGLLDIGVPVDTPIPEDAGLSQGVVEPERDEGKFGPGPYYGSGPAALPAGSESGGSRLAVGPVGASFGDADGPKFVHRIMPRYPDLARRRGREGLVLLRLVIGPGGELRSAEVVEGGGHGFAEAALAAVRASSFAPAMRGGRAVECAALLPIRFALKGS